MENRTKVSSLDETFELDAVKLRELARTGPYVKLYEGPNPSITITGVEWFEISTRHGDEAAE